MLSRDRDRLDPTHLRDHLRQCAIELLARRGRNSEFEVAQMVLARIRS